MIKPFKQFIKEQKEYQIINLMLQDYVSGSIEEFSNTGSFMELFNPEGEGLPKVLKTFDLIIFDKGQPFTGKGKVISDKMCFDLSSNIEPYKKIKSICVELEKIENNDYMIKSAKVS